ncbi:MAG: type I phosphomannose isomerase catalytic subunit [Flavobacteriaceae bacterium]
MYPIKFQPILKERLWGGTKLKDVLNKSITSETTGESWEISTVSGDISIIANGDLCGLSLKELIENKAVDLLGKSVVDRFGKDFPILIKFIDAKQDLSIQLHPNDALAKERHNSFGKTEMWYIMDADKDADLIIGFNKDVTKETYAENMKNNTLLELLNYEKVKEGDTFFIKTGKIHAIGDGVLLAEIQQTSDVTYRVFDFNRKDKEGKYRELHTELALDAIDYERKDDFIVNYETKSDRVNAMVDCAYFKTNYIELTHTMVQDVSQRDSFTILMCVHGKVTVQNDFGSATIQKGETILVSANSTKIELITNEAKLLEVTI